MSGDYKKDLDCMFQQIEDQKDASLFARLKVVGTKLTDEEIQDLIDASRTLGIKKGMTIPEARAYADILLTQGLDDNWFDENLDINRTIRDEEVK